MGVPGHLTCLLRNLYVDQEETVRTRYGTTEWFKIIKEYEKVVYCHHVPLTSVQSISCKIQAGWITRWNQDCQEKYQQPQICTWYHSNGRSWRRAKHLLLMEMKEWDSEFLGRLIRSLGSPRRRNPSGALKEKIGVWSSQGREKDKHFFYKPRADDCTTKQLILLKDVFSLKLCTNDYITTLYAS